MKKLTPRGSKAPQEIAAVQEPAQPEIVQQAVEIKPPRKPRQPRQPRQPAYVPPPPPPPPNPYVQQLQADIIELTRQRASAIEGVAYSSSRVAEAQAKLQEAQTALKASEGYLQRLEYEVQYRLGLIRQMQGQEVSQIAYASTDAVPTIPRFDINPNVPPAPMGGVHTSEVSEWPPRPTAPMDGIPGSIPAPRPTVRQQYSQDGVNRASATDVLADEMSRRAY